MLKILGSKSSGRESSQRVMIGCGGVDTLDIESMYQKVGSVYLNDFQ